MNITRLVSKNMFKFTKKNQDVRSIFLNVVGSLRTNPRRKYVIGNTGFFEYWLMKNSYQDSSEIEDMIKYIKEGRVEVMNGAVASQDEALPHFQDLLINGQHGTAWLKKIQGKENFEINSWLIDSFGHSISSMRIQALSGMRRMIFNRISIAEKRYRMKNREMNFKWSKLFLFLLNFY